jgi:hypothetical protein
MKTIKDLQRALENSNRASKTELVQQQEELEQSV